MPRSFNSSRGHHHPLHHITCTVIPNTARPGSRQVEQPDLNESLSPPVLLVHVGPLQTFDTSTGLELCGLSMLITSSVHMAPTPTDIAYDRHDKLLRHNNLAVLGAGTNNWFHVGREGQTHARVTTRDSVVFLEAASETEATSSRLPGALERRPLVAMEHSPDRVGGVDS